MNLLAVRQVSVSLELIAQYLQAPAVGRARRRPAEPVHGDLPGDFVYHRRGRSDGTDGREIPAGLQAS
ncbi:MAG: hypothetical protein D6695_06685 [Planctomycetota bacterium]|nr:MAG: hypothetical protein D6695_06685 [Planctomycetota bacterium]